MHRRVVWCGSGSRLVGAGGAARRRSAWRHADEVRKGEEARQQVLTALRITSHALNQMNAQLAAHNRVDNE